MVPVSTSLYNTSSEGNSSSTNILYIISGVPVCISCELMPETAGLCKNQRVCSIAGAALPSLQRLT